MRQTLSVLACMLFALVQGLYAESEPIQLYQSDFANGTYRITEPGVYTLAEDITFNPNSSAALGLPACDASFPLPSQFTYGGGTYDPAAYSLGFFAAITIAAEDVVLDLNGHTIEQSKEHALLQRFFSVIELCEQPFIPGQGPADFGQDIQCARNVTIKDGVIGRSAHHGVHGNSNRNVTIRNVAFNDYEVAAVALNGVSSLRVVRAKARNREDVPVLGTFSAAQFIKHYLTYLVDAGSTTSLAKQDETLTAEIALQRLRSAINNVHHDLIVEGREQINPEAHPKEYALFHNRHGVIDGNSYSFVVNSTGVAVNGFPYQPDNDAVKPSRNVIFKNVHVRRQRAAINEIVALEHEGKPVTDPVGAVLQVRNKHPDSGELLTVSSRFDGAATYIGNVLSDAQLLVAKAYHNGEFAGSHLDLTRLHIPPEVIAWAETPGAVLADLAPNEEDNLCNGDTMFHVNKGVIAFKLDGAKNVRLHNTSASRVENLGEAGSLLCGNYDTSHPNATVQGYGGAYVRGYTFAGSKNVIVRRSAAKNLYSANGSVIGFDVMTDSERVALHRVEVDSLDAGDHYDGRGGPNRDPEAIGIRIGPEVGTCTVKQYEVDDLSAYGETHEVLDLRN